MLSSYLNFFWSIVLVHFNLSDRSIFLTIAHKQINYLFNFGILNFFKLYFKWNLSLKNIT